MLKLIPLFVVVAFALHVLVLQLGPPMLGIKRPHLGRVLITCLLAPFFMFAVHVVVGLPLGCFVSFAGPWATGLLGLLLGLAARATLYAWLLDFDAPRAGVLAAVGTVVGWMLAVAAGVSLYGWTTVVGV